MRNKHITLAVLLLIILLGAFLRFYDLDKNPNGFYVDEASTGYNAWSILLTGKDEYGKSYPLSMRFLGSYTPPLYTYLTAVIIYFQGLSIFSVRFLSVISGILLIPLLYFLFKLLKLTRDKSTILIVSFLFAINPWAIFYSRVGYEVNLAFLLFSLGVLFLFLSLKSSKLIIIGMFFLSLSTNAYHAERLLAHLTIITFLIVFKNTFFKKENIKLLGLGFGVYLLILIPQMLIFFTPANSSRALDIFYGQEIIRKVEELTFLPLFLSWPLIFFREFLSQYFSYFSPRNLFFQPDSDLQRSLPDLSLFYPWMVVLYLFGLKKAIEFWKEKKFQFILALLFISPIPAALAGDPFSSQRALPLLLPLTLIIGLGIDYLVLKFKRYAILGLIIFSLISLIYFYRSYWFLLPNERAKVWGYGYSQLSEEIKKRPNDKFLISLDKPSYIELTFFLKIPPQLFQSSVDQSIKNNYYQNTNWSNNYEFLNIKIRDMNWVKDPCIDQIIVGDELLISPSQAEDHKLTKVFEIRGPIEERIFFGYKTNPQSACL